MYRFTALLFLMPLWGLAGDPVRGKGMYATYCSACHQADGTGMIGLAPSLNNVDFLAIASDDFIKNTVLSGRAGTTMIRFGMLPDVVTHIDDLVSYIRSWQRDFENFKKVNVDWDKKIVGDVEKGAADFEIYCAAITAR